MTSDHATGTVPPTANGFLPLITFGLSIFVAGFLMFLLEPVVGKMLLPLLGGSPNVWTTCVLFFQATLLCGYGYVYLLDKLLTRKLQVAVHLALVWLPALLLPMRTPLESPTEAHPYLWLFATLGIICGTNFFVISTTAPLLQKWYVETRGSGSRDPYFLYALSNLGGLIGLCAYPFYLEPTFRIIEQNQLIQILYLTLAVLISICAMFVVTGKRIPPLAPDNAKTETEDVEEVKIEQPENVETEGSENADTDKQMRSKYARWLLLTFIPASLSLGLTTYVTSEMSPIPLFWLAPLFVYLLSFVIAFSRLSPRILTFARVAAPIAALVAIANIVIRHQTQTGETIVASVSSGLSFHLLALGLVALACHGIVAAERPGARGLTSYYFAISLGGVAGSLFNAIIAPLLFSSCIEYPLILALCQVVLVPLPHRIGVLLGSRALLARFALAAIIGIGVSHYLTNYPYIVYRSRDFFGSLLLRVDPVEQLCELWHGATMHGSESIDPDKRGVPTAYYHRLSPIGKLMTLVYGDGDLAPYAVLGLGAGTIAAYAKEKQIVQFYELDPEVIDLATNPFYFTYIYEARKRHADIRIKSGDGRLEISKAPYACFKVIVIDTFSSDNIPTHIITKEAAQIYLSKIRKDGVLAFHITNEYYDFKPVLARLARELNLSAVTTNNFNAGKFEGMDLCEWVVLTPDAAISERLQKELKWQPLKPSKEVRLWTDDYCNPLSVLVNKFS